MTKAEIIAMATEAGFEWDSLGLLDRLCFERFAALVAAKEREACAAACEDIGRVFERVKVQPVIAKSCAAAIRARGTKEGAL